MLIFSHLALDIHLAEDEFRTYEADRMSVVVCRSQEIGSNVQVTISPMTAEEAILSGDILSSSFPPNQTHSPNRAG